MRLVLSASEFRRGPGFQASFHSEVTLRVSAARRLIRGAKFAASCLRVYLKTPNAPGQRTFSRCAAPFFLEIRQYSCEKMSCSAQKFLAAGHIGSFQIHPRTFAVNRRCRPDLLVCTFLRGGVVSRVVGAGLCSASTERTPKASPHRGRQQGAPHLKGSPPRGAFAASCNPPLLFAAASCKIDTILRFLNGNQEDHHAVD